MTEPGKDLLESMKDAQGETVADKTPRTSTMPKAAEGKVDRYKRDFNPEIHVTTETGDPVFTREGNLRIKSGKGGVGRPSQLGDIGPAPAQPTPDQLMQDLTPLCLATGASVAQGFFTICQAIGSDEWKPTPHETSYMVYAWGQYFQAKGLKDAPPEVILLTAMAPYVMPRLVKPKTKGRIKQAGEWIRVKLGKKPVPAATEDAEKAVAG